jgi:hypothetical protein
MLPQTIPNRRNSTLVRENLRLATSSHPPGLSTTCLSQQCHLTETFSLSLRLGDLQLLGHGWYVTHSGLLRLAHRDGCAGLQVQPVYKLCDASAGRYAFRATVFKSLRCKGFIGYGDADPSNVSPLVRGAEMRVAETRAVNRALRKAYGIGICSVEEIGSLPREGEPTAEPKRRLPQSTNGNENGSPRVRDRLCQLIRRHSLDPELVKSYATDFCGTKTLKEATRAQVEDFVEHLADWAEKDRNALLAQLNSYLARKEKEGAE